MKFYGVFGEGSKINQVVCAILINIPVFAYGAGVGWMSPMTLLLQSENSPRGAPLSNTEVSVMAALPYLLCPFMDILAVVLTDKYGRKLTIIFVSFTNAISWLLLVCCYDTWALILSRVIFSVSMAGCFVTCPVYTKEISDDSIRGSLGCFVILFQTVGNLFLYVIGDILSYDTVNGICLCIPIIHVLVFFAVPESPSYLVKKGKMQEATKVMAWLRCRSEEDTKLQHELELIRTEQKNDEGAKNFLLKRVLTDKILRKAFIIALVATLAREVCGAIPVLNFAGEIFSLTAEGSRLILSPNQQAMVLGTVQVIGSILASSVIEKVGRKPLLFMSSLLSGLSMCLLASWFLLKDYGISAPSWIPLLSLCLCIFCDASGLQPISMVLVGEIFSFKYRGTVLATVMAVSSAADFIQLLFFKPVAVTIGIHASFFFFGGVCLLMAVYVILAIPETKSRSIEDIYHDLTKVKKNNTNTVKIHVNA